MDTEFNYFAGFKLQLEFSLASLSRNLSSGSLGIRLNILGKPVIRATKCRSFTSHAVIKHSNHFLAANYVFPVVKERA
jgi:hypothetical protein